MHCSAVRLMPAALVLPRLARDLVAANQIEREIGSAVGERNHAAAELGAEIGFDLVGIMLESGIDLPAIAARGAPARLLRFQHDRVHAQLRQMQRARQPRKAAADDRHGDASVAIERRCRRRRNRGLGVKARRQRKANGGHQ